MKKQQCGQPYILVCQIFKSTNLLISESNSFKGNTGRLKYQWSPHHIVAQNGLLDLYQILTKKSKEINPMENKLLISPLHFAAEYGHFEVSKFIIENSVDKNPKRYDGVTPLHYSAQQGHFNICKLIIESVRYG